MRRTLGLWIAFTGWGATFAIALLLAAVVLGAGGGHPSATASPLAGPDGMFGMITALIAEER